MRGARTAHPKSKIVAARARCFPVTAGGAAIVGRAVPGAAPYRPCLPASVPGATVIGGTLVVGMPTVLHPLPDIADHVAEAEGIGGKAADRPCPLQLELAG